MKTNSFLGEIDSVGIVSAITAVEAKTTGEIRVWVSDRNRPNALEAARSRFLKLKMDQTKQRNAILIFVAPQSRTFAIVGDVGIDEKSGEQFWVEVRDVMKAHLRESRYTAAIMHAIETAGARLAEHFPADPEGRGDNELPNEIVVD